jgi:hypothetical protein
VYFARPADERVFYQGDILRNVPVTTLPLQIEILRPDRNPPVCMEADVPDAFGERTELVVAEAYKTNVMILSQTCDIQQRAFVVVAPVQSMTQVTNRDRRRAIMEGKVNHRFWLPAATDLEESYVELTILNSVPKELLRIENRFLSLSDGARHQLTDTLHRFFCRPVYYIPPDTDTGSSSAISGSAP